jgi:hypothetical protein
MRSLAWISVLGLVALVGCGAPPSAPPIPSAPPPPRSPDEWLRLPEEQLVLWAERAGASVVVTPAAAAAQEVVAFDVSSRVPWPASVSVLTRLCRLDLEQSVAGPFVVDRRARVTLEAPGVDVRHVLRRFAAQTEVGVVVSSDVAAVVSLSIVDRPWTEALASIRDAAGVRVTAFAGAVLVSSRSSPSPWRDDDLHAAASTKELLWRTDGPRWRVRAIREPLGRVAGWLRADVDPRVSGREVSLMLSDVPRSFALQALALAAGCEVVDHGVGPGSFREVRRSTIDAEGLPIVEVLRAVDDRLWLSPEFLGLVSVREGTVSVSAVGAPTRPLAEAIVELAGGHLQGNLALPR